MSETTFIAVENVVSLLGHFEFFFNNINGVLFPAVCIMKAQQVLRPSSYCRLRQGDSLSQL